MAETRLHPGKKSSTIAVSLREIFKYIQTN